MWLLKSTPRENYGFQFLLKASQARKAYTITRARERWSDDEHLLFLEGMKLHGRSWGRVANHVQTKTTIQIRSHAQKYFNRVKRMQGTHCVAPCLPVLVVCSDKLKKKGNFIC
jgi:SHAQKYF class myb-like DNA-binding protein